MDFSNDVKTKYPDLHENGAGEKAPEVPKKKEFTAEEKENLIQSAIEQFDGAEKFAEEQGIAFISFIEPYETVIAEMQKRIEKYRSGEQAAPAEKAAEVKKEEPAADDDPNKYFYDFEKFPPLKCLFLGNGKKLKIGGKQIETWKVQELDEKKTEWLLPHWKKFSEEQGNFFGFPKETPGKFIYLITFKGQEPESKVYLFDILKKLPPTNGK